MIKNEKTMSNLTYRYPGLKPFSREEQVFFYGREKEKKEVCRLLDLDNLLVLHSPSGLGKSSLINAGILPEIERIRKWEEGFQDVQIRFTNYDPAIARRNQVEGAEEIFQDPVDRFNYKFEPKRDLWNHISQKVIPLTNDSFWLAVKWKLTEAGAANRIVLVLDQFEEIFTYPDGRVDEFALLLGELYYRIQPEAIREALLRKKILGNIKDTNDYIPSPEESKRIDQLIKDIEVPLDIKILLSMRSDKLSFLERFKPFLPEMMLSSYELRSFTEEQARQAIIEPALKQGENFLTPSWEYTEENLEKILNFLRDKLSRRIDPSQLQIICQNIEKNVAKKIERQERKKKPFLERIFRA